MTDNEATATAQQSMEKSRLEVMECESEINSIKNALKSLAMGANAAGANLNHLEVSICKVKRSGDAEESEDDDPSTFKVHVSSPIEEQLITKLYDPLDPTSEGSIAKFDSIEVSNALLTVEVLSSGEDGDGDAKQIVLGASAPHDLLPLCQDMELWRKGGEKKSSTLEIAIVAATEEEEEKVDNMPESEEEKEKEVPESGSGSGEEEWEDAVAEEGEKEGGEEKEKATEEPSEEKEGEEEEETPTAESDEKEDAPDAEEETEKDEAKEATTTTTTTPATPQDETKTTTPTTTPKLQLPLYTLTVQLEYTPSPNDKRDALYEKLNEVSKRKVAAIDSLRKNAALVNRAKAAASAASSSTAVTTKSADKKSPAVRAGFLNKKTEETTAPPPPFWKRWYEKTIGPKSMLWVVGPVAKNYVIFVGVSLFIHFKGDLLALPPPV